MDTGLGKLKRLMAAGEYRAALKLAASWHRLGVDKADIERGWAAFSNPGFYREIGQDPEALVLRGLMAIRRRYGIESSR